LQTIADVILHSAVGFGQPLNPHVTKSPMGFTFVSVLKTPLQCGHLASTIFTAPVFTLHPFLKNFGGTLSIYPQDAGLDAKALRRKYV
jgi:hypothetical protein